MGLGLCLFYSMSHWSVGLFGLLVYFSIVYFSMHSLNKPNKPVYFSMHSLTGQWDSVRFIGLFGLSVYFSMFIFPCVLSINQINRFISPCVLSLGSGIVSGLLVYLVYRFISPCVLSNNQINRLPFFLFNGFPEVCTK